MNQLQRDRWALGALVVSLGLTAFFYPYVGSQIPIHFNVDEYPAPQGSFYGWEYL